MEFKQFNEKLRQHVESISKGEPYLFVAEIDPDVVWDTYLESFSSGTSEIFRELRRIT